MYDCMTRLQEMEYIREDQNNMKAEYEQVGILQCRWYFVSGAACWVFIDRHWKESQYSSSGMSGLLYDHINIAQYQQGRLPNLVMYKVAEHMQWSGVMLTELCLTETQRTVRQTQVSGGYKTASSEGLVEAERGDCILKQLELQCSQVNWDGDYQSGTGQSSPHHITSHHITSHHITSHHITSHHITSHHITSHHITSHHITSHHVTSHHTTPHTCCLSDASAPQASCMLVINSIAEAHIWNVCQTPRKSVLSTRWSLALSQTPDIWCYSSEFSVLHKRCGNNFRNKGHLRNNYIRNCRNSCIWRVENILW